MSTFTSSDPRIQTAGENAIVLASQAEIRRPGSSGSSRTVDGGPGVEAA
jgi:hypothetical protein